MKKVLISTNIIEKVLSKGFGKDISLFVENGIDSSLRVCDVEYNLPDQTVTVFLFEPGEKPFTMPAEEFNRAKSGAEHIFITVMQELGDRTIQHNQDTYNKDY